MSEKKNVKIPFHDGTTRLVPYGTPIEVKNYSGRLRLRYAYEDGCGTEDKWSSKFLWAYHPTLVVTTVLAEWVNPDRAVELPRNIGAVGESQDGYMVTRISDTEWRSDSGIEWANTDVEQALCRGRLKIVHTGHEENGCEE